MKNQKEQKQTLARTAIRNVTADQLRDVVGGDGIIVIGGADLNPQPLPP